MRRRGASRCARAACTARACSRCAARRGRADHRIHRRGDQLARGAAPPPARPERPQPHLLLPHRRRSTSSTPSSAATRRAGSTTPASPTARPTRSTAASSSRRCATSSPGEELFYDYGLVIDERYTPKLKKQFECRCGTPALPRHDAGAQALTRRPLTDAGTQHLHWGAEALWQQLEPLLPGLSVEVRGARRVDQHRAAGACARRERPARRARHAPGELTRRGAERARRSAGAGRRPALPAGGRAPDGAAAAASGAAGSRQRRRVADLLAGAAAGAGATGRACRWRSAWRWPRRWTRRRRARRRRASA